MTTKLTPKAQAEQLLENLLKGREVHEMFSERMRKRLPISGKNIDYWEEKFRMAIPTDNMNPTICKELSMKLLVLHQEATFYHAVASAKAQVIKKSGQTAYLSNFAAIVEEYKLEHPGQKLPGQETLKSLASIDNDTVEAAVSIAEVETKYWKEILDHLHECRKLIENASMNIAVELKAMSNDNAIEKLAMNGNGGNYGRH
jgi:hypothetical protein